MNEKKTIHVFVNNTINHVFDVINLSDMNTSEKGLDNWFLVHVILRLDLH